MTEFLGGLYSHNDYWKCRSSQALTCGVSADKESTDLLFVHHSKTPASILALEHDGHIMKIVLANCDS